MAPGRESRFRAMAVEATPVVGAYMRRRLYPLGAADLDDLVEDVLIVAWRRFDDIPADATIPWMIGVARNVLRNAQRKHRRMLAAQDRVRPAGSTAPAEESVVADEGVRQALAALSDDDREILLLHAWDGRSAAEIAVVFHLTTNAAAVRLSRAEARFRKLFTDVAVE